jgi:3-hydroxybutyryl-CoA dehydrogenase
MNNVQRKNEESLPALTIGVVGMGEMGATIAACLLAGGCFVAALAPGEDERRSAKRRVGRFLKRLEDAGELKLPAKQLLRRLKVSREYSVLRDCRLVIESVIEELEIKRGVIRRIEEQVSAATLIGTNTSTLSVTSVQEGARDAGRVLGLHWISSSPFVRGVELMPGAETRPASVEEAAALVRDWEMQPIIARQDSPGFIGNRIYYAMLREAFHIVEAGIATPEDVDKTLRNGMGSWLPFAGLFGYLDLNGLQPYPAIMDYLFPQLSAATEAPHLLRELVAEGANGVSNGRGIYQYTPAQAKKRARDFENFRRDVLKLVREYSPTREGDE